jgi:hypothetical protein
MSDGELTVDLVPQGGCSQVSLLMRCSVPSGEVAESGLELVFEPREGRLVVRQLSASAAVPIASCGGVFLRGDRLPVRIRLEGDRLAVFLGDEPAPTLQAMARSGGPASGRLGVRAWGSGVSLDQFCWTPLGGVTRPLWPELPHDWARYRAFESACLLLLNLNEVAYVD